MKHLFICPELPPARGGGIGTYVERMSRLLADRGESVHVIGPSGGWAGPGEEHHCEGRLVIHRLGLKRWSAWKVTQSVAPRCSFSWQAALLAERIIAAERIDVIEAQEYLAPLYWLQVRRVLGLGPARKPPCIVHLHSPSALIAGHNETVPGRHMRRTVSLEEYSIRAADALIAPSHDLARWAEARYALGHGSIEVLPLPTDSGTVLARHADTWSDGAVSYVGRLEMRKGVIEWVDAAVRAAEEFPSQRFEFLGADTATGRGSMRKVLESRIPASMRPRFSFFGAYPRSAVRSFLRQARIAVIPSRWENYPHSCMEAMQSGLPVIGTRTGGVAEMVTDGRTGWLTEPGSAEGLFAALRTALRIAPETLATMGATAAHDIRRICDPERVVGKQLRMRNAVLERGVQPNGLPAIQTIPLAGV